MILCVSELTQWLGVSVFELWLHTVATLVFCVLLAASHLLPETTGSSWPRLMAPLFVGDALAAYFSAIVLIRNYVAGWSKPAAMRTVWSVFVLALLFTFKYLLLCKLSKSITVEYSEVMAPLFVLLNMIIVRACQL